MININNQNWRVCSSRQCREKIYDQMNVRGPVFCSEQCRLDYIEDHPYYAPSLSPLEVEEAIGLSKWTAR